MSSIKTISSVPAPSATVKESEKSESSSSSLFEAFKEYTTFHGVRHVFGDGSKIRRLIWCLCVIGSTTYFFKATSKLVSNYLSRDVVTRVTLVNQDFATFPAVTICNFNPLRKDYITKNNLTELVSITNYYGFGNISADELIRNKDVQKILNTSVKDLFRDGAHKMKKNDMFERCSFQRRRCFPEDFQPVHTRMGLCYTFNKDPASLPKVRSVGGDFGLDLELDVQQYLYYGPRSQNAGFKVYIHNHDEPPLVKENGFAVMPGTCTFVAVRINKIKSLPPPFRTKCRKKKLPGISGYSKPLCHESCRVYSIIQKCGCRDSEMPDFPHVPICTYRQRIECVIYKEEEFLRNSVKNCSCPRPCDLTEYETRLSYAQYPSEHVKETLAPRFADRYFADYNSTMSAKKDYVTHYLELNGVYLKVFLQDLNYNIIEDISAYHLESLFAEAGGLLGLLLGASILTIVEFFEFLCSYFAVKYFNCR